MELEKPKLLIIAGPNGSGKTSVTGKILKHEWIDGCTYINPDNIAQEMFGDWNSPEAIVKAALYTTQQRYECIENGDSILIETVLSSKEKLDFIILAKQKGYFIRLFFVGTNHPTINASRIAQRVMEGGHDVPISKIISRYAKSIVNCALAARMVDRLYIYDNSVEDVFPELLFRASSGKMEKVYTEINTWANPIKNALHK